jgi:hypothetical protein
MSSFSRLNEYDKMNIKSEQSAIQGFKSTFDTPEWSEAEPYVQVSSRENQDDWRKVHQLQTAR